jgi:hypothetical protein
VNAYYRGGNNLKPRRIDLRFDRVTGFVLPKRGVSVYNRPDGLDRFGGAFRVDNIPPELTVVQTGVDRAHFEIIPVRAMPLADYEAALAKITLTRL